MSEATRIIEQLGLTPHPEGGHYRETYRHVPEGGGRGAGTAIYFLLRRGEVSRWHRVDADEVWHHYAGAPLALSTEGDDGLTETRVLGTDLTAGERPQLLVPAGTWQSAESLGDYTLVGATVTPAFEFAGFEIAPMGWEPGGD